ncbi:non-ribosomal peptide synthetase [Oerskovia enterophila]|uniref:non-ribosomal peptide synthetase n=1 Tax=Oerskovia enterophila TaxID=43678 RepID=UPI00339804AB
MTTEIQNDHMSGTVGRVASVAAPSGGGRETSLVHAFDAVADAYPDHRAIEGDAGAWSYRELQDTSRRIAEGLSARGALPGTAVAMLGGRSAEACATMLGILRVGGAYVPLDEALPPARLEAMLAAVGSGIVVRLPGVRPISGLAGTMVDFATLMEGSANRGDLAGQGAAPESPAPAMPTDMHVPAAGTGEDDVAYVMFTSGSTGVPKAVGVRHRGVLAIATRNGFLDLVPGSRVLHGASLSFDASTIEIWATLLAGGCLVVVDSDLLLAPTALARKVREARVDTMFLTTGVFHHAAQAYPELFDGLRCVMVGGEALNPVLARRVAGRPAVLVNGYGPTETTVFAAVHLIEHADDVGEGATVPIGRALPYARCEVVRPDGSLADVGEDGELYIAGDGVAAGYLRDPEETGRQFVHLALGGTAPERFYRTGDQVRQTADGLLEFRGRLDHQVKVRGFRIELAEIENMLTGHPGVGGAAVLTVEDDTSRHLVAFYTSESPAHEVPDATDLRKAVLAALPAYMVPATFLRLEALPLGPNGKVDRRALAAIAAKREPRKAPTERATTTEEATDVAAAVARAWWETLRSDEGDREADFFELGGSSLTAAQLIARVQAALDLDGTHGHALIKGLLSAPRLGEFVSVVEDVTSSAAGAESGGDRWRPDVFLLERPAPVSRTVESGDVRTILLTGATGFFGSGLLRELLDRTDARIVCLVRARDASAAVERVRAAQERYGHAGPLPTGRVTAISGDLAAPRLGLGVGAWDGLASQVDLIHHAGAHVNFVYPYEWLRGANVDGTRNLVELAQAAGGVPIHYVSTIAVLAGSGSAAVREVTEETPLDHVERLSMGYPESKWVAERILQTAAARGLPVVVYRPYEITGDTVAGRWNTEAALCAFFKAIVEMGFAPAANLPLDFVPSDYLARAVIHLAGSQPAEGQTYHLTNPRYAPLSLMVDRLRAHGHRIETLGYTQWLDALTTFCTEHPEHPVVAFLPIFTNVATSSDVTVKELYFEGTFPRFGRERTERDLASSGLLCPPVDADMLDSYIRYFHAVGYIRTPLSEELRPAPQG